MNKKKPTPLEQLIAVIFLVSFYVFMVKDEYGSLHSARKANLAAANFIEEASNSGIEAKILSYLREGRGAPLVHIFVDHPETVVARLKFNGWYIVLVYDIDRQGNGIHSWYLLNADCNEGKHQRLDEDRYNRHVSNMFHYGGGKTLPSWDYAKKIDLIEYASFMPWVNNIHYTEYKIACAWDELGHKK